ncbi:MAG: HNH endonuclease signature motif containing protein [Candidatus Competibacteraceae bacterium]
MNPAYPVVSERAEHRCEYCHAPELVFNFPVEHIVPLCRGGANADANWALACRSCNLRKGVQITSVDPSSGAEIRLFDPRQDHWVDHLRADLKPVTDQASTAIGCATVAAVCG